MRTRNNKLINFILEFSQILLVFLGVYSAIMCSATSLELTINVGILAVLMFGTSILFYGLFTVLETFHRGKLYGILGLLLFYVALAVRFSSEMKKGAVTIINSFLKQFMNFSGSRLTLLTYKEAADVSLTFCTNLVLILVGVFIIAITSAFFYRKRRSKVFLFATAPFVILPLFIGKLGYFSNLFTYLIVTVAVVGTRHLKTDATDRRMRQKLSLILMVIGLLAGGISWLYMPPERYERGKNKILQVQNSVITMASWEKNDLYTFFRSIFDDDAITYGKIGKTDELVQTGKTLIRISSKETNKEHSLYMKGFVGDVYKDNKWTSLQKNDEYVEEYEKLQSKGTAPDSWHMKLRNVLGESQLSGVSNVWETKKITVKNLSFGYGNYLIPYEPAVDFKAGTDGCATVDNPGIQYEVEYYSAYSQVMRRDFWNQHFTLGAQDFWDMTKVSRDNTKAFVEKYYLQVPDSVSSCVAEFHEYLKANGDYYNKYKAGTANEVDLIRAAKAYVNSKTSYSLKPGKTPSDMDSVEYFLNKAQKGYCTYYATTLAMLLRSVGIPTRYVEGVCVTKEQLAREGEWIDVPDNDVHAWIEVYNDYYGFVPVEVTPGRGEEDDTTQEPSNEPGEPTEQTQKPDSGENNEKEVEQATPTPAVSEVPEESMEFNDIDGNEEMSDEELQQSKKNIVKWVILDIVIVLLVFASAMELQRRLRKYFFAKNQKQMKGRRKVRLIYHHILPVFLSAGIIYRGQTVAEYTAQVAEAMKMQESDIEFFVAMIYRARFGVDDISKEELLQYSKEFRAIRDKAYENASWWKRLYYMYVIAL